MSTTDDDPKAVELVIVGGGPAGMSAALVAGRALLDTVIVNAESPRNAATAASHGFLTRDGARPSEILALAGFISDEFSTPTTTFTESLGVTSSPTDWGADVLDVDDTGGTNIDGLFVVGDARTGLSGLVGAAAEGSDCAETVVQMIAAERWGRG